MTHILFKENKYTGKYVATRDFDDSTVIGYGATPQAAYKNAAHKGYKKPVISFVPAKEMVQIY